MTDAPDPEQLAELEAKIEAAKAAKVRAPRQQGKYEKATMAWRMVIELVVGMIMGLGIGFGLDSLFGTLPIFLMIFALLGFAAGVRVMMHTAVEMQNRNSDTGNGS